MADHSLVTSGHLIFRVDGHDATLWSCVLLTKLLWSVVWCINNGLVEQNEGLQVYAQRKQGSSPSESFDSGQPHYLTETVKPSCFKLNCPSGTATFTNPFFQQFAWQSNNKVIKLGRGAVSWPLLQASADSAKRDGAEEEESAVWRRWPLFSRPFLAVIGVSFSNCPHFHANCHQVRGDNCPEGCIASNRT